MKSRAYIKEAIDQPTKLNQLVKSRYSPRAFEEKMIDSTELELLLHAARWSASSMNLQPWRFRVAEKGSENFVALWKTLMDGNKPWARHAAVLLATFVVYDPQKPQSLITSAHDLGLAVSNMTIQAESMGIGVHQMGGFSKKAMSELLNLENNIEPMTVLALGYYGTPEQLDEPFLSRETAQRTRKDLKDLLI
jgi:nitroreductase